MQRAGTLLSSKHVKSQLSYPSGNSSGYGSLLASSVYSVEKVVAFPRIEGREGTV